jgi:hypothetical protein
MDEGFALPVNYKGKELLFPAQLVSFGWTHRIQVDVYGMATTAIMIWHYGFDQNQFHQAFSKKVLQINSRHPFNLCKNLLITGN